MKQRNNIKNGTDLNILHVVAGKLRKQEVYSKIERKKVNNRYKTENSQMIRKLIESYGILRHTRERWKVNGE